MQGIAAHLRKNNGKILKALQSFSIGKLNVFSFLCSTLVKCFFMNTTDHYDILITLHDGVFGAVNSNKNLIVQLINNV